MITSALKGVSGEFEIQRILGGFGTVIYSIVTPVFVAAGTIKDVSLTEFALAYPAGLAACIGATAGAIAVKDRATAAARRQEMSPSGSQPEGVKP